MSAPAELICILAELLTDQPLASIKARSVNLSDVKVRGGIYGDYLGLLRPRSQPYHIVGMDGGCNAADVDHGVRGAG